MQTTEQDEGSDTKEQTTVAKYEFSNYNCKKYNLETLDPRIIKEPPFVLLQHENIDEIFNYILDKSFQPIPLRNDLVDTMR